MTWIGYANLSAGMTVLIVKRVDVVRMLVCLHLERIRRAILKRDVHRDVFVAVVNEFNLAIARIC